MHTLFVKTYVAWQINVVPVSQSLTLLTPNEYALKVISSTWWAYQPEETPNTFVCYNIET
jgi:hypothetical protein